MQWLTDLSDSLLLCDLLGIHPCLQANAIYLELERMGESFEQANCCTLTCHSLLTGLPLCALNSSHRLSGMGEKQAAACRL